MFSHLPSQRTLYTGTENSGTCDGACQVRGLSSAVGLTFPCLPFRTVQFLKTSVSGITRD